MRNLSIRSAVASFLFFVPVFSARAVSPEPDSLRTARSDSSLRLPYLQGAGHRGAIAIWIVDGAYIRTTIDEEFTNYGQHGGFSFIPENEFWLDREAREDERQFYIDHLLVEHRLMENGMPYDDALAAADSAESAERAKSGDLQKVAAGNGLPDPARVHVLLWKKLESGVSVWIVDGRLVRSVFDVDFTEGGHEHVYEFVPENEVWIDNDLSEAERPYILLHELHERNLMAKGWTYGRAHDDASRVEASCRHHPEELHNALAMEGWE